MSSAEIKLQLYRLIDSTDDASVLKRIYTSLSKTIFKEKTDWWSNISDDEKAIIEAGLADIERGETVSNEEVIKESRKLINKYKK